MLNMFFWCYTRKVERRSAFGVYAAFLELDRIRDFQRTIIRKDPIVAWVEDLGVVLCEEYLSRSRKQSICSLTSSQLINVTLNHPNPEGEEEK